jgi:hypothetical protein
MVVRVEKVGLAYYPIPKVACSSLKYLFFHVNEGISFPEWRRRENFQGNIHHYYPSPSARRVDIGSLKAFVVLRDPFARAVSTWANKVPTGKFRTRLEAAGFDFAAAGLDPNPSLELYLTRLADYLAASPLLRSHAGPVRRFCPPDLEAVPHLYRLEEPEALAGFIASLKLGVPFGHRNASAGEAMPGYSRAAFAAAMEALAPDYAFLARWYAPPAYRG